ncbi:MAG TPA: META domain-containing protein [Bacilli bacterium]|nr:META domain-containing protein [Bacilli bacterium]
MKKILITLISILIIVGISVFMIFIFLNKDIKNTSWQLTGWSSTEISPDIATITINFSNDEISGIGGVNSYSGNYKTGLGKKVFLGDISSTEMASTDDNINAAETLYFSLLQKVEYYKIENDILMLLDKNKNTLLIFSEIVDV